MQQSITATVSNARKKKKSKKKKKREMGEEEREKDSVGFEKGGYKQDAGHI